jgi:hypothetical protein
MCEFETNLQTWLGVPMSSLHVTFAFRGEESADMHAGCVEQWTQRHNPFLGKDAPPTFLQGWADWHRLMFDGADSGAANASDLMFAVSVAAPAATGVVFVVETGVTTASAYLRCMAIELGLPHTAIWETDVPFSEFAIDGYSNSAEHGYDRQRATTAVFLKLPPNQYTPSAPFGCCDVHRTLSVVGARPEEHADACFLLRDVFLCSTHSGFEEMDPSYAKVFRRELRSVGVQALREVLRSLGGSPCSHWKRRLPALFAGFDAAVTWEFFSCRGSMFRLLRFFERWGHWEPSAFATLHAVLLEVVPEPRRHEVLVFFRDHGCGELVPRVVDEAIVVYRQCVRRTISAVLDPMGCAFARHRVLQYVDDFYAEASEASKREKKRRVHS